MFPEIQAMAARPPLPGDMQTVQSTPAAKEEAVPPVPGREAQQAREGVGHAAAGAWASGDDLHLGAPAPASLATSLCVLLLNSHPALSLTHAVLARAPITNATD